MAFEKGKEVAFWLRELLHSMSLEPIVKTSGKTGLHVFVPIKRTIDFDAAREVSELVGRHLMRLHPKDITLEWSVPKRTGKIFMDYNMNVRGKTLNVAYSPRGARRRAGLDAADLGRAGRRASTRLQHHQRRRAPGRDGRSLARCAESASRASSRLCNARRHMESRLSLKYGRKTSIQEEGMAARSIGSLTISFGLVSIPVKLYSATEASQAISFNLLHKDCGSRLKQQYFCVKEEVPVAREEMVKGYEFAKDQYVMFTPEELKALEEAGTQTADITEFVPLESIDPVYFDKAYYLAPDKGGAKPYALLARALRESGRCALGRWAARGKQYIVMIRPVERTGLVMQQLLYAGEVRSIKDIEIPKTEVQGRRAEARAAADRAAGVGDVRSDRVQGRGARAHRGGGAEEGRGPGDHDGRGAESGGAQVIDLMEALRASLDKKTTAPAKSSAPEAPAREARKPAKRATRRRRSSPWHASRHENSRPSCTQCMSTACAMSRSCCACRAARSARWSKPGSYRRRAGRATLGCFHSRT